VEKETSKTTRLNHVSVALTLQLLVIVMNATLSLDVLSVEEDSNFTQLSLMMLDVVRVTLRIVNTVLRISVLSVKLMLDCLLLSQGSV
jgi:hypothetical protein